MLLLPDSTLQGTPGTHEMNTQIRDLNVHIEYLYGDEQIFWGHV